MERTRLFLRRALFELQVRGLREDDLLYRLQYGFLQLTVQGFVIASSLCRNLSILLQEIRTLVWHIQVQHKAFHYFQVIPSYSSCSPTQRRFWNSYNRARSACISEMVSKYPKASRVDLQLFLEGWDEGEKWAFQMCNLASCTEQLVANTQDQPLVEMGACSSYRIGISG